MEAERDPHAEPRRFVVGDVPPLVWGAALGVPGAALVVAGVPAMQAVGVALAGAATTGLVAWGAAEKRRRARLAAAEAAHATERAALLRTVRALYARPWDVVLGDTRWVLAPGEVAVAKGASP